MKNLPKYAYYLVQCHQEYERACAVAGVVPDRFYFYLERVLNGDQDIQLEEDEEFYPSLLVKQSAYLILEVLNGRSVG